MNRYELAQLAWPDLAAAAAEHRLLTYKELATRFGYRGARAVRFALGPLQDLCLEKLLPPLTSVVVIKRQVLQDLDLSLGQGVWLRIMTPCFVLTGRQFRYPFPMARGFRGRRCSRNVALR